MNGRTILILVVGFSLIYLIMGNNFGSVTNRAVINAVDYYNESLAHNIAVSGAKMAANEIFITPTWTAGYSDVNFQGGKINVSVLVDSTVNSRTIIATGLYNDVKDTVIVVLKPSKFSKFAYYSVDEQGIWWASGDTVWGPLHTQDYLRVSGSPVFCGKVTTQRSIKYYSYTYNSPKFLGGFEKGVSLAIPSNSVSELQPPAVQNGRNITGRDTVYLTFQRDTIKFKYAWNGTDSIRNAASWAPNGVIYVNNAIVRLKGVVKGKYTVAVSGAYKGDVYLDDDIVYQNDPLVNPYSQDMLGIIAENDVIITRNVPNGSNININASIFCQKGGFGAEDYDNRGFDGYINLTGGIIQNVRAAVGTIGSGGGISNGFSKRYKYDNRFMIDSPPMFPNTNSFEIVSWLE